MYRGMIKESVMPVDLTKSAYQRPRLEMVDCGKIHVLVGRLNTDASPFVAECNIMLCFEDL